MSADTAPAAMPGGYWRDKARQLQTALNAERQARLAAEAALAAEREYRKRLERRIHCQRVANRDNWMIVEQRGKSLRATAIHYISRGRALFDAGYDAGKAAAIRAQGE